MVSSHYSDASCGIRSYLQEALPRMSLHGQFTYTLETFLDLNVKRLGIIEVPIKVRCPRQWS
jgi:hypothetical protein